MTNSKYLSDDIEHQIIVDVESKYHSQDINKKSDIFIWIYNIKIKNFSTSKIQIIERYWQIFDANGYIEEVNAVGVVGQQPIIEPNEIFKYTSQVCLFSNSGLMQGKYLAVEIESGKKFKINIPAFSLDINNNLQKLN